MTTVKYKYISLKRSLVGLPLFIKWKPNQIIEIDVPGDFTNKKLNAILNLLNDWVVGLKKYPDQD